MSYILLAALFIAGVFFFAVRKLRKAAEEKGYQNARAAFEGGATFAEALAIANRPITPGYREAHVRGFHRAAAERTRN